MSADCELSSALFASLQGKTLAHPPKSEFVEKERKIKSLLFRQFIYVNLGILVALCKNLPFTPENE